MLKIVRTKVIRRPVMRAAPLSLGLQNHFLMDFSEFIGLPPFYKSRFRGVTSEVRVIVRYWPLLISGRLVLAVMEIFIFLISAGFVGELVIVPSERVYSKERLSI